MSNFYLDNIYVRGKTSSFVCNLNEMDVHLYNADGVFVLIDS